MLNRENAIQPLNNNQFKELGDKVFFIKIKEIPFLKKINLRLDPNDKNCVSSCSEILGTMLPTKANTYSTNAINEKVIWLGPNEWLIVSDDDAFFKLLNEIGDLEASLTDVSENRTIIRIRGRYVYVLLSKFLVLDLEKNLSTQTSCAQTLFVKVPILLVRNNSDSQTPEIDIFVNRSYANYIYNLLVDGTKNLDL